MIDWEKVIKALTCCTTEDEQGWPLCEKCPYCVDGTCPDLHVLHRDALALLKAQEPRLLQAADFQREDADTGGGIPCWKETRSPTRRNGWAVIVYGKWLADAGIARYWTGKPTQAQMENTPWLTEEE